MKSLYLVTNLFFALLLFPSCSPTPRKALTNYIADLQSGKTVAWHELRLGGHPLPFLSGPPVEARDQAFQGIIAMARVRIEGEEARGDRRLFKLRVDALDTEKLLVETIIHSTFMKRMAGPNVKPDLVNRAEFLELLRLARMPEAPRTVSVVEVALVKKENGWTVEAPTELIGAMFGFKPDQGKK